LSSLILSRYLCCRCLPLSRCRANLSSALMCLLCLEKKVNSNNKRKRGLLLLYTYSLPLETKWKIGLMNSRKRRRGKKANF
jgi:hypothetical protein